MKIDIWQKLYVFFFALLPQLGFCALWFVCAKHGNFVVISNTCSKDFYQENTCSKRNGKNLELCGTANIVEEICGALCWEHVKRNLEWDDARWHAIHGIWDITNVYNLFVDYCLSVTFLNCEKKKKYNTIINGSILSVSLEFKSFFFNFYFTIMYCNLN